MPAAGRREGRRRAGGEAGRGVSGRPRLPPAPRCCRHTPRELEPGAGPSCSLLAAAAQPPAGGSPVVTMSVAPSNRFQGRRAPPRLPPAAVPGPPGGSPGRARCAPPAATCAPRGLPWARAGGAGRDPSLPGPSLSPAGGKAFGMLKARQERRLAEINRVSASRLRSSSPAAAAGAARGAPRSSQRPAGPTSICEAAPSFLSPTPPPPGSPVSSLLPGPPVPPGRFPLSPSAPLWTWRLGLQVVTLRLGGGAGLGAAIPACPPPPSPPGTRSRGAPRGQAPSSLAGQCPLHVGNAGLLPALLATLSHSHEQRRLPEQLRAFLAGPGGFL